MALRVSLLHLSAYADLSVSLCETFFRLFVELKQGLVNFFCKWPVSILLG